MVPFFYPFICVWICWTEYCVTLHLYNGTCFCPRPYMYFDDIFQENVPLTYRFSDRLSLKYIHKPNNNTENLVSLTLMLSSHTHYTHIHISVWVRVCVCCCSSLKSATVGHLLRGGVINECFLQNLLQGNATEQIGCEVNIGSVIGLVSSDNKLLPESMLTPIYVAVRRY